MKKIILLIILVPIFFLSCTKDVLNKPPLNLITDDAVWNDQNLIDAYLSSAFVKTPVLLNECPNRDNYIWYGDMFWINEIADEAKAGFNYVWNGSFADLKAGG